MRLDGFRSGSGRFGEEKNFPCRSRNQGRPAHSVGTVPTTLTMLPLQQVQSRKIRKIYRCVYLTLRGPSFMISEHKLTQAITFLTDIQVVSASNLGSNVNYPEVSVLLFSPYNKKRRDTASNCSTIAPFPFVPYHSSSYRVNC
jgi:hypothetical protein